MTNQKITILRKHKVTLGTPEELTISCNAARDKIGSSTLDLVARIKLHYISSVVLKCHVKNLLVVDENAFQEVYRCR